MRDGVAFMYHPPPPVCSIILMPLRFALMQFLLAHKTAT